MNISGTNQPGLTPINYISSTGSVKTLARGDSSAKDCCLRSLELFKCQKCCYVHEKPLLTRCCDAVLCATCYLSLSDPKKCPSDDKEFKGTYKEDLKPAGLLVKSQIKLLIGEFNDVRTIGLDTEKSTDQNDALENLESSSSQKAAGNPAKKYKWNIVDSFNTLRSPYNVIFSSQGSDETSDTYCSTADIFSIKDDGITINGTHIDFKDKKTVVIGDGQIVSGHFLGTVPPAAQPWIRIIKTFDFISSDVECIDVETNTGSIFIEKQNCDNQEKISFTSSAEPIFRKNMLVLACNEEDVSIKIPESFTNQLKLSSNTGEIRTCKDYRITSGGYISTNCGSVDLKVNSKFVDTITSVFTGSKNVQFSNHHADRKRQQLVVSTNTGSINIHE